MTRAVYDREEDCDTRGVCRRSRSRETSGKLKSHEFSYRKVQRGWRQKRVQDNCSEFLAVWTVMDDAGDATR